VYIKQNIVFFLKQYVIESYITQEKRISRRIEL